MLRRPPTRIELKDKDVKEYEASVLAKTLQTKQDEQNKRKAQQSSQVQQTVRTRLRVGLE